MLRLNPKEKAREKIAIPEELLSALREAWRIIDESKRDSDVRVNYDDAIQVLPWLVGGRVGTKKRPYQLTYYVKGDRKTRWYLGFHPLDIEDIVDGRMSELVLYCCRTPNCGLKSSDPDFHCGCDYENDPYFGHIELANVTEALSRRGIVGISATSTRTEIAAVLGAPNKMGGGFQHEKFGYVPPWIKFYRNDCQLHFQFTSDGNLKKMTIMEADWKPGFARKSSAEPSTPTDRGESNA